MYEYKASVKRVVDGDTIDMVVDMGFYMTATLRFRVLGINTPELRRGTPAEKAKGREAKDRVWDLCEEARIHKGDYSIVIRTEKADSFGRWLAEVWLPAGLPSVPLTEDANTGMVSLGEILLYEKLAVPYKK